MGKTLTNEDKGKLVFIIRKCSVMGCNENNFSGNVEDYNGFEDSFVDVCVNYTEAKDKISELNSKEERNQKFHKWKDVYAYYDLIIKRLK